MHSLGFPLSIGNERLLFHPDLTIVETVQRLQHSPEPLTQKQIREIEDDANYLILYRRQVLVCGFHNRAHQIAACAALRWGSPLILVAHYDARLTMPLNPWSDPELPFEAGRCWSHSFDEESTLLLATTLSPLPANEAGCRVIEVVDRSIWWLATSPLHLPFCAR